MGWRLNLYVAEVELVARDWPCDHWPLFSNVGGPLVSQRMMYILYCQLWSLMGCFRAGWVLCSSQLIFLPQLTLLFSHTPLFNLALKLERNLSGLWVWLYTAVACKLSLPGCTAYFSCPFPWCTRPCQTMYLPLEQFSILSSLLDLSFLYFS